MDSLDCIPWLSTPPPIAPPLRILPPPLPSAPPTSMRRSPARRSSAKGSRTRWRLSRCALHDRESCAASHLVARRAEPSTPQARLEREQHPLAGGLRYVPFDFKRESKKKGVDVLQTLERVRARHPTPAAPAAPAASICTCCIHLHLHLRLRTPLSLDFPTSHSSFPSPYPPPHTHNCLTPPSLPAFAITPLHPSSPPSQLPTPHR